MTTNWPFKVTVALVTVVHVVEEAEVLAGGQFQNERPDVSKPGRFAHRITGGPA